MPKGSLSDAVDPWVFGGDSCGCAGAFLLVPIPGVRSGRLCLRTCFMRSLPVLVAISLLFAPVAVLAQTTPTATPASSPSAQALPSPVPTAPDQACTLDNDGFHIGTRIVRIHASVGGSDLVHIGPLIDVRAADSSPIIVHIDSCTTDGSEPPNNRTINWSPTGAYFAPLQFQEGADVFALLAFQGGVPVTLTESAPIQLLRLNSRPGTESYQINGPVSANFGTVPLTLSSASLQIGQGLYRLDAPSFSLGTGPQALRGAMHLTFPMIGGAAKQFGGELNFGAMRLTNLHFFQKPGWWRIDGDLAIPQSVNGFYIDPANRHISIVDSGVLQFNGNPHIMYKAGSAVSFDAGISSLSYSSGALSMAGSLRYEIGGAHGDYSFSGNDSSNGLALTAKSNPDSVGSPVSADRIDLSAASGTDTASITNLTVNLGDTVGLIRMPQLAFQTTPYVPLAITHSELDMSQFHANVRGLKLARLQVAMTDGQCRQSTSAANYFCLQFQPEFDLGAGTATLDTGGQPEADPHVIAFDTSWLVVGFKPQLMLGKLKRVHVRFGQDGLAFNLRSCSDSNSVPSDVGPYPQLCLNGTVTLPRSFANVVSSRVVAIEKFSFNNSKNFEVCVVACNAQEADEAFDVTPESSALHSDLDVLFAPTYGVRVQALDFTATSDSQGDAVSATGTVELLHRETSTSTAAPMARMDIDYFKNTDGKQEVDLSGGTLVPLKLSDMSLLITKLTVKLLPTEFHVHAGGVASLANEPLTVVVNDLGVDAVQQQRNDVHTNQSLHDWKISFTHDVNKWQSLTASGVRAIPRAFQLVENALTFYFAKWIIK